MKPVSTKPSHKHLFGQNNRHILSYSEYKRNILWDAESLTCELHAKIDKVYFD